MSASKAPEAPAAAGEEAFDVVRAQRRALAGLRLVEELVQRMVNASNLPSHASDTPILPEKVSALVNAWQFALGYALAQDCSTVSALRALTVLGMEKIGAKPVDCGDELMFVLKILADPPPRAIRLGDVLLRSGILLSIAATDSAIDVIIASDAEHKKTAQTGVPNAQERAEERWRLLAPHVEALETANADDSELRERALRIGRIIVDNGLPPELGYGERLAIHPASASVDVTTEARRRIRLRAAPTARGRAKRRRV